MDKLPIELLHYIFCELFTFENAKSMLVCKKWAHVIRTRSLLHTIHITGPRSLYKIGKLLNKKPELALQVETLHLSGCGDGYFHKSQFPAMFLKLKRIIGEFWSTSLLNPIHHPNVIRVRSLPYHSTSEYSCQIKHVSNIPSNLFSSLLATKGFCSHLTSLDMPLLNYQLLNDGTLCPDRCHIDLSKLKDMPVLETLQLASGVITCASLEMIHGDIPSLKSLTIPILAHFPSSDPKNVVPAEGLTSLNIVGFQNEQVMGWAFQYIRNKYPNLKHLFYYDSRNAREDVDLTELPPLLHDLGSQLESLTLFSFPDHDEEMLANLDKHGCHIKNLTLYVDQSCKRSLGILCKTNQSKHIETLDLQGMPAGTDIGELHEMENLQSLSLQYEDPFELDSDESWPGPEQDGVSTPIRSLGDLVGDLPTSVHTLEISNSPFKCDENHGRTFLVKKLTLVDTCLFGDISPLLANHFPHLHALTLGKVFEKSTTLTLSNHHFSCLRFVDNRGGSSTFTLCLVTSGGASHRYYTVGSDINRKDMIYNPLPSDVPMHHKVVTIICGSVKKLFLNEIEVDLNIPNAEMGK